MKRASKNNFSRIIPILLFSFFPLQAIAQVAPRSIEGGDGVFFSQSPKVSEKGKVGLKLTSYYHSERVSNYNSNVALMKVASSGEFGITNRLELQGMVSTFAQFSSNSTAKYQTGLGIAKIGIKYSLPAFKRFPIPQAIKISFKTPGGNLIVDNPVYPFDGKAYSMEALYMASIPISYNKEGIFLK